MTKSKRKKPFRAYGDRGQGRKPTPLRVLHLRGSWKAKVKEKSPPSSLDLAYENFKADVLVSGYTLDHAKQLIDGFGYGRKDGFGEPEESKREKLRIGTQEYTSVRSWYSDRQLAEMLRVWVKLRKIIYAYVFTENLHRVPCTWPQFMPFGFWQFESPERRNEKETEGQQIQRMGFEGTVTRLYEPFIKQTPNQQAARENLQAQFESQYVKTMADE
jgi:hypothetical protein